MIVSINELGHCLIQKFKMAAIKVVFCHFSLNDQFIFSAKTDKNNSFKHNIRFGEAPWCLHYEMTHQESKYVSSYPNWRIQDGRHYFSIILISLLKLKIKQIETQYWCRYPCFRGRGTQWWGPYADQIIGISRNQNGRRKNHFIIYYEIIS